MFSLSFFFLFFSQIIFPIAMQRAAALDREKDNAVRFAEEVVREQERILGDLDLRGPLRLYVRERGGRSDPSSLLLLLAVLSG